MRDETANVEIRRWGEPRKFALQAARPCRARQKLAQLDFEAASKISGARFTVLTGPLARDCIVRWFSSCSTCIPASTAIARPMFLIS